jgi:hypothetical protein
MKKLIITTLAVVGLAAYVNAQGTFIIDTTANFGNNATPTSSTGGLVFINGVLDTGTDINLGILFGSSAGSVTTALNIDPGAVNGGAYTGNINWIASQGTGSGDITSVGGGTLFDPNGNSYIVPGIAPGSTVYMIVQGWTGSAASYSAAQTAGAAFGQTSVFSFTLASSSAPNQPGIANMSSLNLVSTPEPSTLAMAGLGGFGMLMAMRRKKA